MKIWITKYALTKGIIEADKVEQCDVNMVKVFFDGSSYPTYFHGKNWHTTEHAAKEHANEMLKNKITLLTKQLKKLEKKQF